MAGLSERGVKYLDEQGIDQIRGVLSDPYDRDSNPGGLINMGTAENVRLNLLLEEELTI